MIYGEKIQATHYKKEGKRGASCLTWSLDGMLGHPQQTPLKEAPTEDPKVLETVA